MPIRSSSMGGTPFGTTANRPSSPQVGQTYYNGTLGYLEIYTSAGWAAAAKGIAFGNTANRPASPDLGTPYFNGQEARLELYTSNGWQNIVQETPSVVSIVGQLNESATSTLTINGTNFATGAIAYVVGTNGVETVANTTTLVSVVEITAVFPALPPENGPYDVKIVNTSNLYGVLYETLGVNDNPVWSTSSGSLGTFTELDVVSVTVAATDATDSTNSPLQYSLVSGSLPTGFSLNSTTGVISGTAVNIVTNTTYSFTIGASDSRNTIQTRAFSITINDRSPVWTTSSTLPVFTKNVAYSTTVSATEDESGAITYSLASGSLPTGLSLSSSGLISGTPTSSTNASFTLRATVTESGNTADRAFTMANAIPVWVTTTIPPARNTGDAYSFTLNVTDDGTLSSITLISGTLPSGFTYNASNRTISGSSTSTSSTSLTFRATDDNGSFVDQTMTFAVAAPTIVSITSSQAWVAPSGVSSIDLFMVGGGGAGGITAANGYSGGGTGGGGGGGTVYQTNVSVTPSQSYNIVVGSGGARTISNNPNDGPSTANHGSSSTAFGYTAFGGCGGPGAGYGDGPGVSPTGGPGAGGSSYDNSQYGNKGAGWSSRVQGFEGGLSAGATGGGGGGAGSAGISGGAGGNGVTQFGVTLGGGGGAGSTSAGTSGTDGGGNGATGFSGNNATANTGGGGGGIRGGNGSNDPYNESGAGGSGRVIIRYF